MIRWLFLLFWLAGLAQAAERVPVCYGYGCLVQVDIVYGETQLAQLGATLASAADAGSERAILAEVMGQLYRWGGEQSPIHNDRGGNFADEHGPGKMDCIDHSTSTTRLLQVLERRGYLRWHHVLAPDVRHFLWLFPVHWSAVIEENGEQPAARFAVDSWFVDNGQPAVILPLHDWKKGAGPNV